MTDNEFEAILDVVCLRLSAEAQRSGFLTPKDFERRVRSLTSEVVTDPAIQIDPNPPAQAFPDIAVGKFGIEVKFTTNDTWLSIANSVLESNRIPSVDQVYVIFGKMGGTLEVRWSRYEDCIVHVRTSHVPRFEVELPPTGGTLPLFQQMNIAYDDFRRLPMDQKMPHIREYARGRLKKGERLWWLEDSEVPTHTLPLQASLYTRLTKDRKTRLRAEAALLCPQIVGSAIDKYDDVPLYLLTYRGVLSHNTRDMFTAGSVSNPTNDDNGGIYTERALKLIESEMLIAANELEDALFIEYWGESVPPVDRIAKWLEKADGFAKKWTPSTSLFKDYQNQRVNRPHIAN
ncbi:hypothetical protein [Rhodoferax sp. PAMC 29310]|uniref:hypothetical protein n=1 Tax=Rhodoferax sp. PAMC 29310 TaxID=2822760 RepID=UPI001B31DA82|nr:hypothetical protein [Rhodoferax sp. PAMC 29310]